MARKRKNLFNHLDARIVAQIPHARMKNSTARALREQVRADVEGCTSCELYKGCKAPVAFEYGEKRARFAVVGEAPGPKENDLGRPFVGPSGRMLRTMFDEAGIDSERVTYINSVSCFPNVEGKVRTPTKEESKACYRNLMAQLNAANVEHVMLVGGRALDAFRTDLKITEDHGKWFLWVDRWVVMPVLHPAGIMRAGGQGKRALLEDIKHFGGVLAHEVGLEKLLGDGCVRCGREAGEWDRDGVPYCGEHWVRWGDQWEKERKRWENPIVQLTL